MEYVLATFTSSGVPQTGLTPTIRIWDVTDATNTLVINNASMTEIGDGGYKYVFTGYNTKREYYIRCDGGAALPAAERYTYGGNDSFRNDIADQVWDEQRSEHLLPGSMGEAMDTILADLVSIEGKVDIIKGLSHENIYIDETTYDSNDNLVEARMRIYSDAVSVGTNNNILATYRFYADGDGPGKFTVWRQVKV